MTATSKRGLCFVPNVTTPQDDDIWTQQPSDLIWYYNYHEKPSHPFQNQTQEAFEFVPMLWGPPSHGNESSFVDTVKALVRQGRNITHVMTFNEPEMHEMWGGANMIPSLAAETWIDNITPLRTMGIKAGLPATAGTQEGLTWLTHFLGNCSQILSQVGEEKDCTFDFVPFHHYGDFESLASAIGQLSTMFPATPLWLTEFNYHNQSLEATQDFYQRTTQWLDGLALIERYALFGAFRSDVSNVGPNAAMLSDKGQLTDVGLWYLGRNGRGAPPINNKPLGVYPGGESPSNNPLGDGVAVLISALSITLLVFLFL